MKTFADFLLKFILFNLSFVGGCLLITATFFSLQYIFITVIYILSHKHP